MRRHISKALHFVRQQVPPSFGLAKSLNAFGISFLSQANKLQSYKTIHGQTVSFQFSKQSKASPLSRLTQLLQESRGKTDLLEVKNQITNILGSGSIRTFDELIEFHLSTIQFFEQESQREGLGASLLLREQLSLYLIIKEKTGKGKNEEEAILLNETYKSIVGTFDKHLNNVKFESEQALFEVLNALANLFEDHKNEADQLRAFSKIESSLGQQTKQANCEQYLSNLMKRVTMSQLARNHDDVFVRLDWLFSEIGQMNLSAANQQLLVACNSFYTKAILLTGQFSQTEREQSYKALHEKFVSVNKYESSSLEKLLSEVKALSDQIPNFFEARSEIVNQFVENYEGQFSEQVRGVLLDQIYNQVVPLSLYEYFYMLIKFEDRYRIELEEVEEALQNPEDLVDDFQEQIYGNLQTLLQIRKLIQLLTQEVIQSQNHSNLFKPIVAKSWIGKIGETYEKKCIDLFQEYNQHYV